MIRLLAQLTQAKAEFDAGLESLPNQEIWMDLN